MSTDTYTVATRANMRAFERANPGRDLPGGGHVEGRQCFAYDVRSGERYSASSGDYFYLADDEPLTNEHGEPLILAVERTVFIDALSDEALLTNE